MISSRKKAVLVTMIVLMVFGFTPRASAFGMPDIFFLALKAKQYYDFWRGIRGELNALNSQINQEILTGDKTQNPDGEPSYIEYWRDFIGESQFRGENVFRVQLANTNVCDYLKESLQAIYGISDFEYDGREGLPAGFDTKAAEVRVHPYELTARCTLATIEGSSSNDGAGDKDNQNRFLSDWISSVDPLGSYIELSKTQNNFYGAYLLADKEFKNQANFEKEKDVFEALANDGYKGARDTGDSDQEGCIKDSQERCVVLGKISTPGGILSEASAKTITSEWDIITNRNEGSWESILGSLIDKFLNFNTGTGVEGDDNTGINGIVSLQAIPGSGYNVDFRDAKNHQACIRDCDERLPPKKADGCSATPETCTACIQFRAFSGGITGNTDRECALWGTVACESVVDTDKCDIEDDNYSKRASCYEDCGNKYLFPDPVLAGGRCGVNFPQPQCTCEAIDSSVTYEHLSAIVSAQQSLIGSSCSTIGVLCDDRGPHGLGRLEGGLNDAAATQYMNALISAINSSTGLTASYEFFGAEPILAVFDGTKTEHYDVITSSGNVWNNGGKVICTPNR